MSRKDLITESQETVLKYQTRRHFLRNCSSALGAAVFSGFSGCNGYFRENQPSDALGVSNPFSPRAAHFLPKAKSIIYLHLAGSPSQLDLFDYKPELDKLDGKDCPRSLLDGKRFAFIQDTPQMLGPQFQFERVGEQQTWVSELMPHFKEIVDDVCILKAMHTNEFNHAPAQLFLFTGSPRLGRPSLGSWVTYGLGTENSDLPGYIVLVSGGKTPSAGKSIWGSGFLPTVYQGVQCRSHGEPILYVDDPKGMSRDLREKAIETINQINQRQYDEVRDPEILSRIAQYEMAFKMQVSVPGVMDISDEPEYIHELYGTDPGKTSLANNCLLARRLAEKGVRFVQIFDWGWDAHGASKSEAINHGFIQKCKDMDQPVAALIKDLKQRGMLDDVLVVWGGEFGRTPMRENRGGVEMEFIGRDHHTEAYTMWMAGGGVKPGMTYGETDEIGYYGIKDRIHIHDLQATILHQLGLDHERLTYHYQGRDFRLTDVHGHVVYDILA